jgi:hypothetical protein
MRGEKRWVKLNEQRQHGAEMEKILEYGRKRRVFNDKRRHEWIPIKVTTADKIRVDCLM